MKELRKEVEQVLSYSNMEISELTFEQFNSIINFQSYDKMIKVLTNSDGSITSYPSVGDYSLMTDEQSELIQMIEKAFDQCRSYQSKVGNDVRSKLKNKYPEKAHLVDWMDIKWNELKNIYSLLKFNEFNPIWLNTVKLLLYWEWR